MAADSKEAVKRARLLYTALSTLRDVGKYPLVVLSAGNVSVQAKYNGWAGILDPSIVADQSLSGQVLVVGGIDSALKFWADPGRPNVDFGLPRGSNFGPLVEIVAPAQGVYHLDTLSGGRAIPDCRRY